MLVTSEKGHLIEIKREGSYKITRVYEEEWDIRPFKERPQEKLEEASKHKYEVVGTMMSTDYEDMATSEEERQVEQLSETQKLEFKEMKDLMTVQGRLKGIIPGFKEGIQMQVTGRYPGVPTAEIKKYVVPEEGQKADLHLPPPVVEQMSEAHDAKIPMRYVNPTPGRRGVTLFIDPELDHDELFEEDLEGNLTQKVILGAKKVKKLEEERKQREQEEGEEREEEEDEQAKETREAVQSITEETVTEEPTHPHQKR